MRKDFPNVTFYIGHFYFIHHMPYHLSSMMINREKRYRGKSGQAKPTEMTDLAMNASPAPTVAVRIYKHSGNCAYTVQMR